MNSHWQRDESKKYIDFSKQFFQDQYCIDSNVTNRNEIVSLIECIVLDMLKHLNTTKISSGVSPLQIKHHTFFVPNTSSDEYVLQEGLSNVRLLKYRRLNSVGKVELDETCENQRWRTLFDCRTSQSYAQMWQLLAKIMSFLNHQKTVTQRELYYMTIDSWTDQNQCNSRLAETCLMLKCPRECVGLVASSRGFIYGSLSIRFHSTASLINVRNLNSPGVSIPGSIMLLDIENIEVKSNARFILVIEKDGVYRRLIEDGLARKIPGILVTACGFPDMATRYMIYCLWKKVYSFSSQSYIQTANTAF